MIEKIKSKIIETLQNSEFANYYPDIQPYQGLAIHDYLEITNFFNPSILVTSDKIKFKRISYTHTCYPLYTIRFVNNNYNRNKGIFFEFDYIFSKCKELLLNNDLSDFFGTILNKTEIAQLSISSAQHYDVEYKRIVEISYSTHFNIDEER